MKKNKKKTLKEPTIFESRQFEFVLILMIFILAIMVSFTKINGEDDIFWHLSTGKFIIENKYVPDSDVFGFATQGAKWIPFEWGWDVIIFLLYRAGGFTLLYIFNSIIFSVILLLIFLMFRKSDYSAAFTVFLLILFIIGVKYRIGIKPQMFSYLFLALTAYILIRVRYFQLPHKYLLFLPPVFLIWANLHMGILAGLLLTGIFTVSEFVNTFNLKKANGGNNIHSYRIRLTLITYILIIAASLINPDGYGTYVYAVEHTGMELIGEIFEWLSPFHENYAGKLFIIIYYFFGIIALHAAYRAIKSKDYFSGLSLLAFLLYSLRAVRFTADFLIIAILFIPLLINRLNIYGNIVKFFINRRDALNPVFFSILVIMILLVPGGTLFRVIGFNSVFGTGIYEETFPVKVVDFIKSNGIQNTGKRPFHTFEYGGYYLWNLQKQNFIDSRNLNDSIYFEFKSIMNKSRDFEGKIKNYNFDYSIIFNPLLTSSPKYMESTIVSYLSTKSNEWSLVYFDDKSMLFVKNNEDFKELSDRYRFTYITPFNIAFRRQIIERAFKEDKETILKEYKRKKTDEPESWFLKNFDNIFRVYLTP